MTTHFALALSLTVFTGAFVFYYLERPYFSRPKDRVIAAQ